MTLDLYLIRHGQSVNNIREDRIGGQAIGVPLTEHGEWQAAQLGKYLKEQGINPGAIYASTAERAASTARIACAQIGREDIILTDKLLEISQGDYAGKRRSLIYTPELRRIIDKDPLHFRAPNGESHRDVEQRVMSLLEHDIGYKSFNGTVLAFGHGMQIKCTLHAIMQFDPHMTWKIGIANTSITKLRYDDKGWNLDYINATPHIDRRDTHAA